MSAMEGSQRSIPMSTSSALTRLKPFRVGGSHLSGVIAACCIIAGVVQQGFAQDAAFTGVWTYSRDAKEQAQRHEAIDRATNDMNRLVRGRARQMLQAKTAPLSKIRLIDGGGRVTISKQDRRVTFTTDGSPTRMQSERGATTLRAKRRNGQLIVTSRAQNGVQTTVYSVSKDRTRLILDITISAGKLKEPVRYRTTYHRASE